MCRCSALTLPVPSTTQPPLARIQTGFPFLCYSQSLLLHVFWFAGWASKYGKQALGFGQTRGKGKQKAA